MNSWRAIGGMLVGGALFWTVYGVLVTRRERGAPGGRLTLVASIAGVAAGWGGFLVGLARLANPTTDRWLDLGTALVVLCGGATLAGVAHANLEARAARPWPKPPADGHS